MANQGVTCTEKITSAGLNQADQQIPLDVDKNTGWPQPTTPEKSDAAEGSPPQNRRDLDRIRGSSSSFGF